MSRREAYIWGFACILAAVVVTACAISRYPFRPTRARHLYSVELYSGEGYPSRWVSFGEPEHYLTCTVFTEAGTGKRFEVRGGALTWERMPEKPK